MSDDDVRAALRIALADEPAPSRDPDAAAAAARHTVRRRRSALAAGALTVALMGGVAGAVSSDGLRAAAHGFTRGDETVTPPVTAPTGSVAPVDDLAPARLLGAAAARLAEVAPDVREATPMVGAGEFTNAPGRFAGVVRYVDSGGAGWLAVEVAAPGVRSEHPCVGPSDGGTCTRRRLADGSVLETDVSTTVPLDVVVRHERVGGGWARVHAYEYSTLGGGGAVHVPNPFTADQLAAIATDPVLTLGP